MYDELFRTLFEKEPSHSEAVPFRMGSGEPCLEGLDTGDLFLHGAGVFQHQAAGVGDALQGGERTAHVDAAVAEDDGLGEGAAGQGERLWGGRGQEGEVLQMDVGDAILYGFGEGFRVLAREADVANVQHDACGAVERVQEREEGLDSVEHVALILVYAANAQSFGRVVDLAGARGDDGNGFCRGRVRGAGTEAGQQRMVQKPAAHFGGGARHTDQALALPAGFVVVQVGHDGQAGQSHAHFVRVGAHAPGVGIVVEVRRAV